MEYIKKPGCRPSDEEVKVSDKVSAILERIKTEGTEGILSLNREIDSYEGPLLIEGYQLQDAISEIDPETQEAIEESIRNVRVFHREQNRLFSDFEKTFSEGRILGIKFRPVENVGAYVPGGRYPLPSSAIMTVVPAQEAGVRRICVCSPPSFEGRIHPVVLGTLYMLGVEEVFAVGGAQAIGAMAFGISPLPRCDMLIGPGNAYVTEAKRQVFGTVGIDSLAGPSEVLIIADLTSDPQAVALDLLAQAEHDPFARPVLFALDRTLAEEVQKRLLRLIPQFGTGPIMERSWENRGAIILGTLQEAVKFANDFAPEHLQINTRSPESVLNECHSFGAAFLGNYCSVPFGDYILGTNHVLPTFGSARFSGGLWTGSFIKAMPYAKLTPEAASLLAIKGVSLAETEGLLAHASSMKYRISMGGTDK